ncbi:hypothetical protein A9Q84_13710 [Halobacteriovorax marinus]|uniref:Uncharacterized protein n=1 Tax=Halobacteriovorax marinus TaxID=97084 RepID=A0A1Y5F8W4_9BACT|nr:hypothetical protein A9Q84_13710 [Halobacteriovorax marinus]
MENDLIAIFKELDKWIEDMNEQSLTEGFNFNPNCSITILGQMGLLVDEEIAIQLNPVATVDLDAWVKSESSITQELKSLLSKNGLILDELSNEIWLPEEYEVEDFYISDRITCLKVKPLYLLVSKAIKAKEKNRILVKEAIGIFKEELVDMIIKYGGDPSYFING